MEIIFTGICSLVMGDVKLTCSTSLLMFPIYGLAGFFSPVFNFLVDKNILLRGGIYTIAIFLVEYISGDILRHFNMCPWDYSNARFNINGLIRLDFVPLWFFAGLVFEYILSRNLLSQTFNLSR